MVDIEIGNVRGYGSSIRFLDLTKHTYLSQNTTEYWYSSRLFYMDVHIEKECEEGQYITKLVKKINNKIDIQDDDPDKEARIALYLYLEGLIIKNMSVSDILMSIDSIKKFAYEDGKRAKLNELKKFLEII